MLSELDLAEQLRHGRRVAPQDLEPCEGELRKQSEMVALSGSWSFHFLEAGSLPQLLTSQLAPSPAPAQPLASLTSAPGTARPALSAATAFLLARNRRTALEAFS